MWHALESRRGVLFVTTAIWLSFGIVAGAGTFLAESSTPFWEATAPPLLASLIWIPLTTVSIALALRFPLQAKAVPWMIHLAASLTVGFVLNLVYQLLLGAGGLSQGALEAIRSEGFRWIHLNGGTYWLVIGLVHAYQRFGPATADEPDSELRDGTLAVRSGKTVSLIPLLDIDWIEGAGDYARIHAGGKEHLATRRLKDLERELPEDVFARVHRSSIANLTRVRRLRHLSHGDYELTLEEGTRLRLSRGRRGRVLELLKKRELSTRNPVITGGAKASV